MKNEIRNVFIAILIFAASGCSKNKNINISSPDGKIVMTIFSENSKGNMGSMGFSIMYGDKRILLSSNLGVKTIPGIPFYDLNIKKIKKEHVANKWINNFGERKEVPDNYNQVKVSMEKDGTRLILIFRAYNEGIAFAYEFPEQKNLDSLTIIDEKTVFRFPANYNAWSASRAQAQYFQKTLSEIDKGCERPLLIEIDTSLIIALAEAKLIDYARMKFESDTSSCMSIRTRLDGEVRKSLPFQSPWRVVMIGKNSCDLLEKNYLLLNLNDPSEIADISWIKPGKVLREVTLTTAGAKAAINFTSSHKMQYIEFDAGWYGPENNDSSDARAVNLDPARSKGPLDLDEVIRYAKSMNIGILLYVNRRALEKQIDELLPIYKKWGIAGIKFGFVQVGTQDATRWLHESIKKVAEYEMVADVHDEYRPTGFSRTYPNFLTMEGIRGDEESPSNSHTLITMFTRMLAGQGDNTICYYNERVEKKMGSHASQLAKAVCIFSPLQFLYWYDKASPSIDKKDGLWGTTNYIGDEPELEFFDEVPTVWDETKVLHAKIGEYGIIARKKNDEWFVGGINGEQARKLNVSFTFLDKGIKYSAKIYSDDPSVNTRTHVRIDTIEINRNTMYPAVLEANNGFAMQIVPVN